MCGINGAIVFKQSGYKITPEYIAKMRDTMIHRGPDGADTWVSPDAKVGLGHRRLSIIDLSTAASQPMSNEDGTVWISFNGEIYNHAEIRAELQAIGGHTWVTDHSDTEMIIHAFEEWGIDCIKKFRGMFGIAIWDGRSRELWLVRDRIGIKPVYYSAHDGRLTFASEIKALLQDPDQKRAVNEEALYHYLTFLTTPAPMTLFAGIKKLTSGCYLHINENGEMKEHRYWDVFDNITPLTNVPEKEICDRLLEELKTAVRYRKVSDVPVGVFLSGGIDSSTNAALFSDGGKSSVKTFSIGYDVDYGSYKNELHFAKQMADLVHADHHELRLTQTDLLDFLPRMVYLQDEPIADPVCVPVYYVSKLARDNGVIVCQVGEGADELFWGYQSWKTLYNLQRYANLPGASLVKRPLLWLLKRLGKTESHEYELLRRSVAGNPIFWGGATAFTEGQKQELLSPRLKKSLKGLSSWDALAPIYERYQKCAWEKTPLAWMSYLDLNLRLPELLLARVDKMSMGVSLEGRVPFLDHHFINYAMSIPTSLKTKNGVSKYILKKAVRGVIPDALIDRPKQGFGVPVYEWIQEELGEQACASLREFCTETDYLNWEAVEKWIKSGAGPQIWYLMNLAVWWKTYIRN